MIESLVHGIGFGFTLSLMIGPVFFGLLQTSITYGFRSGLLYALGVLVSDILLIVFALTIASTLDFHPNITYFIKIIGSLCLCALGTYYFLAKVKEANSQVLIEKSRKSFLIKGFGLNLLTPTVFFFWIATCGFVTATYDTSLLYIGYFFVGCLTTLYFFDMIKSLLAIKIRTILNAQMIQNIQRVLGIILFIAGIVSLYKIFANKILIH